MAEDSYKTVKSPAYALYKEKGSKFLCYSYHVESLEEISDYLEALRKNTMMPRTIATLGELEQGGSSQEQMMTVSRRVLLENRYLDNCYRMR